MLPVTWLAGWLAGCPVQVAKLDSLRRYQLFLVDWGYNTEEERRQAAANGRIEVIGIDRFLQLAGVPAPAV